MTMKTKLLLLIVLSVAMGACTTEEENLSPLWGIEYSDENSTGFASGSVSQFIDQFKSTYIAKTGAMREVNSGRPATTAPAIRNTGRSRFIAGPASAIEMRCHGAL